LSAAATSGAGHLPASILCAVDFSPQSERALRHAVALTAVSGGRLTVVTVNDPLLEAAASAAGRGGTVRDQVEAALVAILGRMPECTPRVIPAIEVVTGEAAPEILRAAARANAALVVIGTQGLGGARKFVFGSTTEAVIRDTPIPVLAIPEYEPEHIDFAAGGTCLPFRHVVAAIGFDPYDGAVAGTAAAWATATNATLTLTHVCAEAPLPVWWPITDMPTPPALEESLDAARRRVEALAATLGIPATADVRRGSVSRTVAAVVHDSGAGLLVVSRGGTSHRVGTIAYRVMREADVPTLVVASS
jgi:nucleotide-binding universal stress UspA family protein